jgi:hypothetical protein
MRTRVGRTRALAVAALAVALIPSLAEAQQPTRRRQAPITIRGTVPTPQVVTVRPREVPTYGRDILVPNFYDRDFWAVILPGYLVVPERMVTGESPLGDAADSTMAGLTPAATPLVSPTDSTGAALALPPLPPRPSRPFTRSTGAPGRARTTPPAAAPPSGTAPSGAPTVGAPGTAPASPVR